MPAVERPKGRKPGRSERKASGAARSSFEETTFGMNSGAGPNRARNVYKGRKA